MMTKGETLVYDITNLAPPIIQCVDASSECIINCLGTRRCKDREIHCHNISTTSRCTLNFHGRESGMNAVIYTHTSPVVFINITGSLTCKESVIYAHENMNTKLYVYAPSELRQLMDNATIYSPVGKGSLLSMKCGGGACAYMKIYDDWTTEVYMQPVGTKQSAFYHTEIRNIFDNS